MSGSKSGDRGTLTSMTFDATLVRAAIDDTPQALERLVDAWLSTVLGWCVRLGGPNVSPEDAAQDVFETVFDRLHSLRDPVAFPAWIYGITRKTLARHRRRAWVRKRVLGLSLADRPDRGVGPQRVAEQVQTAERVWDAIATLPEHHREVIVLCDLEERADSEVAELLGVNRNTIKSRLRRARASLRELVDDLPLPEDT